MRKIKKIFSLALLIALTLCGCSNEIGNTGPKITLDESSEVMLEEIGEDLHVVAPEQFADTVASFSSADVGQVYQLVGYYQRTEGETEGIDTLTNKDSSASIQLRYLYTELTKGDCYTVTGIIAEEAHGEHQHLYFDVIAIESYQ